MINFRGNYFGAFTVKNDGKKLQLLKISIIILLKYNLIK